MCGQVFAISGIICRVYMLLIQAAENLHSRNVEALAYVCARYHMQV